jgi:hypothetical protein
MRPEAAKVGQMGQRIREGKREPVERRCLTENGRSRPSKAKKPQTPRTHGCEQDDPDWFREGLQPSPQSRWSLSLHFDP